MTAWRGIPESTAAVVATAATTWMRRAARLLGIGALALAHAAIAQAESVAEAASELEQLCPDGAMSEANAGPSEAFRTGSLSRWLPPRPRRSSRAAGSRLPGGNRDVEAESRARASWL